MKTTERIDNFSSDDELPLTSMTCNGAEEQNSYKSLCQRTVESCEFCDEVFRNRYNSLIHNATHIIIPLINQNVVECEECHFYFTSQKQHDNHVLKKHALANGNGSTQPEQRSIKMRNRLKFEDGDCIKFSSDIVNNLTSECKVALSYIKQPDSKVSLVISDDDSDSKNKYVIPVRSNQSEMCNSSFEGVCNSVQLNGVSKLSGVLERYDSVHCDLLKVPKRVRCSHCRRKFPDRYNLIIHEATHMDVDRSLPRLCSACDWYISGNYSNLKRHMKTHYNHKPTYKPLKHCSHCGLKYRSLVRHANNYHSDWIEEEKYEKIIHVCDLCYEFLKSRTDRCYTKQGILSEVGKRYTCNQCTRMFFELNVVRTKLVLHNWGTERKMKKKLTNKQRLEKIQNRLLKLNRLRKL